MSDRNPNVDSPASILGNEYLTHKQRIDNFKTDKTDVEPPYPKELDHPGLGYYQNYAQRLEAKFDKTVDENKYNTLITEALDRAPFIEEINKSISRTRRSKEAHRPAEPVSILFQDIDRFKRVNDTFGHRNGDLLLRIVGRVNASSLRNTDAFGRIGGEELAALLNGTDPLGAILAAERIQQNLHDVVQPNVKVAKNESEQKMDTKFPAKAGIEDILPDDYQFPIGFNQYPTISFGIASLQPGHTAEDFLEAGDKAMYKAKQVSHAEEDLDLGSDSPTGTIAINNGEQIYVVNTHPKLIAQRLRELDLNDLPTIKDWLSISLGHRFHYSNYSNSEKYLSDIKAQERDILAAVPFMVKSGTPTEEIKNQLASYLHIPPGYISKDHYKPKPDQIQT